MSEVIEENDWVTPKAEIRNSPTGGSGMFATVLINKGEKVVVWGGNYVNQTKAREAVENGKLVIQWDDNLFSIENRGNDDSYFINHSCNPNLWMDGAFTLVARRNIIKGEEITADYALWEADENYMAKWDCDCGSKLCRKKITGHDWESKDLQTKYKDHFSPLLNKRIEKRNTTKN